VKTVLARLLGTSLATLIDVATRWSSRRAGLALVYHRVGDPQGAPARQLVPQLGTALFESQLGYLRRRYRLVRASELPKAVRERRRGQRFPVAVTFDDDLDSHARVAMPILQRHRVRATFFLCGASLEAPFTFWWERLERAFDPSKGGGSIHELAREIEALPQDERAAAAEQLKTRAGEDPPEAGIRQEQVSALARAGFEIGFHTLRHDPLPELADDALRRALTDGRQRLADIVGEEIAGISYPHGRADARVAAAARAAGYTVGFTNAQEPARDGTDPLLLGRLEPSFGSAGHLALRVARVLRAGQR